MSNTGNPNKQNPWGKKPGGPWGQKNPALGSNNPSALSGNNLPPLGGNKPPGLPVNNLPALGGAKPVGAWGNRPGAAWGKKPAASPSAPAATPAATPAPAMPSNYRPPLSSPGVAPPNTAPIAQPRPEIGSAVHGENVDEPQEAHVKVEERILTLSPKKPIPKYRGFMVTTSLVKVNFMAKQPFTFYKYDLQLKIFRDGVEKSGTLNKEEMITVLTNLYKNKECADTLKNIFWSDMKALFYSKYSIPPTTYRVPLDENREVDVIITPTETITVADVNTDCDERFVQAFSNIIIYESAIKKNLSTSGSRIFVGDVMRLDEILEVHQGIQYNIRMTERGLLMSMDKAASAFLLAGPLLSTVRAICGHNFNPQTGEVGPRSLKDLTHVLSGTRVYTKYQGYNHQYTVMKVIAKTADTCMFPWKKTEDSEPVMTSLSQYFNEVYHIRLQYTKAPVVETARKTYLPIELLFVKQGQRYGRLLSPQQTSLMIRTTASPPIKNKALIANYLRSDKSDFQLLRSFDISLNKELEKVEAHMCEPPNLLCGRGNVCQPVRGAWRHNDKFQVGKSVQHCIAVNMDRGANLMEAWKSLSFGLQRIIPMPRLADVKMVQSGANRLEVDLTNAVMAGRRSNIRYDIVFVFISGRDPGEYKEIKRVTDKLKLPSQCIVTFTMNKMGKKGYFSNIAQKINAKLGGVNQVCASPPTKLADVMICGADVTHPMPGEKSMSIASIVGTYDKDFMQYAGEARVQESGKEVITDVVGMMEGLFNNYYRKNNKVPQSLLFFRDGVGDTMFNLVLREEIPKIYIAFHRCFPTYPKELKVTFLICQKRHSVKFFPEAKDSDRNGNVNPGLVVDKDIVNKETTEFYLQSHATINGTGRPCRYTVLVDDNNISLGDLENLTFSLSHLFTRCMRSIGIVAPARYAHLLCFHTRDILKVSDGDDTSSTSSNASRAAIRNFDFDPLLKEKMFYV